MTAASVHLAGERLMLDPLGGLFWPETGLLAVSDLHLEKGSSHARKGSLLPPWDTHATLDRLGLLLRRWKPRIVVTLGDSFHDPEGAGRLPKGELERLNAMTEAHRFIWVLGNHDPHPPNGIGGQFVEEFVTHPILFRHEAVPRADAGGDRWASSSQGLGSGARGSCQPAVLCCRFAPADDAGVWRLHRWPRRARRGDRAAVPARWAGVPVGS